MTRLAIPKIPSLAASVARIPRMAAAKTYPDKPSRLTTPEVVKMARRAGNAPGEREPEQPAGWWGPVEKVGQGLDILGNEVRTFIFDTFGGLFSDTEKAKMPKAWTGRTIISGSDVARKAGVDNPVANFLSGMLIDELFDPVTYFGGAVAKAVGVGTGRGLFSAAPKLKIGGFRALKSAAADVALHLDDVTDGALQSGRALSAIKRAGLGALYGAPDDAVRFGEGLAKAIKHGGVNTARKFIKTSLQQQLGLAILNGPGAAAFDVASDFFLKWGRRGMGLLHIPFTGIGLEIPGIGRHGMSFRLLREVNAAGKALGLGRDAANWARYSKAAGEFRSLAAKVLQGSDYGTPLADIAERLIGGGRVSRAIGGGEKALRAVPSKMPLIGRLQPSPLQQQVRAVENAFSSSRRVVEAKMMAAEFRGMIEAVAGKNPREVYGLANALYIAYKTPGWFADNATAWKQLAHDALDPDVKRWLDDPRLGEWVNRYAGKLAGFRAEEVAAGIKVGERAGYYPLQMTAEGLAAKAKTGREAGRLPSGVARIRRGSALQPFTDPDQLRMLDIGATAVKKGDEWVLQSGPKGVRALLKKHGRRFAGNIEPGTGRLLPFNSTIASEPAFAELQRAIETSRKIAGLEDELADATALLAKAAGGPDEAGLARDADLLASLIYDTKKTMPAGFEGLVVKEIEVSPDELNMIASNGGLGYLVGDPKSKAVFETDPLIVLANRSATHKTAMEYRELGDMTARIGVRVKAAEPINSFDNLVEYAADHGIELIPDTTYRVPQLPDNSIFRAFGGDTNTAMWLPTETADALERVSRVLSDDQELAGFLQLISRLTGVWKTATLLDPAWLVVNETQVMNHIAAGARIRDLLRFQKRAAKLARTLPTAGDDLIEAGGQVLTERQFADALLRHGVGLEGWMAEGFADAVGHAAAEGLVRRTGQPAVRAIKAGVKSVFDFNQWRDTTWKIASTLSFLEQGFDLRAAVQRATLAGFDYGDMGKLGRVSGKLMTTLVPFYRWLRNSIPFWLYQAATRPAVMAAIPRAAMEYQGAFQSYQSLPAELRPDWFRHELGVVLFGDKDTGYGIMTNTLLPSQDAFDVIGGLFAEQSLTRQITGSLNPGLQWLFESASGRRAFSGQDVQVGSLLAGAGRFGGNIRMFREWPRRIGLLREGKLGQFIGRMLVGGRFQEITRNRGLRQLAADTEQDRRTLVIEAKKAIAAGDGRAADAAASKIVEVFRRRAKFGLKIPKAANEQVGQARR